MKMVYKGLNLVGPRAEIIVFCESLDEQNSFGIKKNHFRWFLFLNINVLRLRSSFQVRDLIILVFVLIKNNLLKMNQTQTNMS